MRSKNHKIFKGFTLLELMIVVVVIAVLAVIAFLAFQRQAIRGYDSKRKSDLAKLQVLFEDYYNDHDCYPQEAVWNAYNCENGTGGEFFAPYLQGQPLPCDPVTNERYLYITMPEDVGVEVLACSGYKLFAALGDLSDGDIMRSGCNPDPNKGCGYEPYKYNYGISIGGVVTNPVFDFSAPTSTPTPAYVPGDNFCLGEPNPEHACNTKAGLIAPDHGGSPCSVVLRDVYGCTSFSDGALCNTKCKAEYTKYVCSETSSLQCVSP